MNDSSLADKCFSKAKEIISSLPTVADKVSFYDLVDVGSSQTRERWVKGAKELLKLAEVVPDEKKFYFCPGLETFLLG